VSLVAGAFHRDILAGRRQWSCNPYILKHKSMALKVLQHQITIVDDIDGDDLDRLIFATMTFARHDLLDVHLDNALTHLFSPHFPLANWAAVYTRIVSVPAHMKAVATLVKRRGGLGRVEMIGLAEAIAR
jgi:hypothetical protein